MPTSNSKTFETYLACDNCGHEDTYEVPVHRYITPFKYDDIDPAFSFYARLDGSDTHPLVCKFCKLPCMRVFWWSDREKEAKQEVNRG